MALDSFHTRDATISDITENFGSSVTPTDGSKLGQYNQLTFELDENGTFEMTGNNIARQKSVSYLDSGIIRSTSRLPATYKITVVTGNINYDLSNLNGLINDSNYSEGPLNENGVYLLTITDELPTVPHTNDWWHQHRKIVIDVDNNIWDWGMPNPIFMAYFNTSNVLYAYNESNQWSTDWLNGVHYEANTFYKIEIERTASSFYLRVSTEAGTLLREGSISCSSVWHNSYKPEYFALGDPHENYYQGYADFKSITMPVVFGNGTPLSRYPS